LGGFYQQRNIPGVMNTLELLQKYFRVTPEQIKTGMETVLENTGLKGRWQKIASNPTVICDTAHNFSGVQQVLFQLASEQYKRLYIIWGMVKDKDTGPVLGLLPSHATYYFCQAKIPRALDGEMLRRKALTFGLRGEVIRDVNEALMAARAQATAEDLIYIGGSTYVVAEIDDL
jgi:dihydrofolate synthase/folylpolyglutamate synthase